MSRSSIRIRRLLWKDLLLEVRNVPEMGGAFVFAIASSSLLGFAASKAHEEVMTVLMSSGLTLIALFLSIFISAMGLVREEDLGTLDGMRSSPVSPFTFFVSKLVIGALTLETLLLISMLATMLLSGLPDVDWASMAIILLSSGIYLAAISALASAISVFLQARGVLLPTMILVLSLPVIQEAVSFMVLGDLGGALQLALSGLAFSLIASWLAEKVLEI